MFYVTFILQSERFLVGASAGRLAQLQAVLSAAAHMMLKDTLPCVGLQEGGAARSSAIALTSPLSPRTDAGQLVRRGIQAQSIPSARNSEVASVFTFDETKCGSTHV
jgi:hypothetical protein